MQIILYLVAIVAANVLTSAFAPSSIFGLIVPQGTLLIGLTFILRDFVQIKHGRKVAYITIGTALILSAISAVIMGNGMRIVIASALSFALSEAFDTELFTRLRAKLSSRVLVSGIVGGLLDSFIFTLAAGFPLPAAWGQFIVKSIMQGIGAGVLHKIKRED